MTRVDKAKRSTAACRAARQMGVTHVDILATAANPGRCQRRRLLAHRGDQWGSVTVLSGADEARMAALGIVAGFENADGVAGDLGGGSLELVDVKGEQVGAGDSLLLGGLRLQAASKGSLKAAREVARAALATSSVIERLPGRTFYAIGGTWRSLARLHMQGRGYPLRVMHEYRIAADELEDFLKLLWRGSLETVPASTSSPSSVRRCCLSVRSYFRRCCGPASRAV
jgi:exopolyphosphatase/guanosine-5'-triphosphate,3'-diphosphate pyrophosphatase